MPNYRKRPKLFEDNLEGIQDPQLANEYVNIQKEINSKYEEINNINGEIAELKSNLDEIRQQAQENREQRQTAREEMEQEEQNESIIYEQTYMYDEEGEDESDDETANEFLFYIKVKTDEDNKFSYAKIFRERPNEEWYVNVKLDNSEEDLSDTLSSMVFGEDYRKIDIIVYLAGLYDRVEEIAETEYLENLDLED